MSRNAPENEKEREPNLEVSVRSVAERLVAPTLGQFVNYRCQGCAERACPTTFAEAGGPPWGFGWREEALVLPVAKLLRGGTVVQ